MRHKPPGVELEVTQGERGILQAEGIAGPVEEADEFPGEIAREEDRSRMQFDRAPRINAPDRRRAVVDEGRKALEIRPPGGDVGRRWRTVVEPPRVGALGVVLSAKALEAPLLRDGGRRRGPDRMGLERFVKALMRPILGGGRGANMLGPNAEANPPVRERPQPPEGVGLSKRDAVVRAEHRRQPVLAKRGGELLPRRPDGD